MDQLARTSGATADAATLAANSNVIKNSRNPNAANAAKALSESAKMYDDVIKVRDTVVVVVVVVVVERCGVAALRCHVVEPRHAHVRGRLASSPPHLQSPRKPRIGQYPCGLRSSPSPPPPPTHTASTAQAGQKALKTFNTEEFKKKTQVRGEAGGGGGRSSG